MKRAPEGWTGRAGTGVTVRRPGLPRRALGSGSQPQGAASLPEPGGGVMRERQREKYLRCRPVSATTARSGAGAQDLLRYRELARELGVSDAAVVKRASWHLDARATLKCGVPRCPNYGGCANCPPHTPAAAETAGIVNAYRAAILLRWEFPRREVLSLSRARRLMIYKTINKIEAAAFYDGYYFACGFATGSCRSICKGGVCRELAEPHQGCRYPLLARPSMEAMGFDVFRTAAAAGWMLNPAGGRCPESVATLSRIAIVLIA